MSLLIATEIPKKEVLNWVGPYYYNHPDGEDLIGKLAFTTQMALYASSFPAILYANLPPTPQPFGRFIRYLKFTVPAVGMAATFTCVTYYATVLRGKDTPMNYVLGGATAGAILGRATGNTKYYVLGPILCAAFGYVKKVTKMNGIKMGPVLQPEYLSSYALRHLDTSLLPEKKGNWTRAPPC